MLTKIFTTITFIIIGSVLFPCTESLAVEESPGHLARAIELYNRGLYDESFDELTAQIEQNRYCALAFRDCIYYLNSGRINSYYYIKTANIFQTT